MKLLKPARVRRTENPDEVIRAFLRVLATLAPRPQGGRGPRAAIVREKP